MNRGQGTALQFPALRFTAVFMNRTLRFFEGYP